MDTKSEIVYFAEVTPLPRNTCADAHASAENTVKILIPSGLRKHAENRGRLRIASKEQLTAASGVSADMLTI